MSLTPVRDFLMELFEQVIGLTLIQWELDGRGIAINLPRNLQIIVNALGLSERRLVGLKQLLEGRGVLPILFEQVDICAELFQFGRADKWNSLRRVNRCFLQLRVDLIDKL